MTRRTSLGLALLLGTACSAERVAAPAAIPQPQSTRALAPCQQQDGACVLPMLIIDGKVEKFEALDMQGLDVEQIEVVKGAEAIKRFGDAGRHGVVIITTRQRDSQQRD